MASADKNTILNVTVMRITSYHFQLMRCHIRHKIKGDFRLTLSSADRKSLIDDHHLAISKSYIVRVLNEKGQERLNLSQHVLDELSRCVDYSDWNAFLRTNPLPPELHATMSQSKRNKRTSKLVAQRMEQLTTGSV